jgi:hypothetical protein
VQARAQGRRTPASKCGYASGHHREENYEESSFAQVLAVALAALTLIGLLVVLPRAASVTSQQLATTQTDAPLQKAEPAPAPDPKGECIGNICGTVVNRTKNATLS